MEYKRYYRARGIAEFILEGHSSPEAAKEFGVSTRTVTNDLAFLSRYGYGKQLAENVKLYKKVQREFWRQKYQSKSKAY